MNYYQTNTGNYSNINYIQNPLSKESLEEFINQHIN